MLNATRIEKNLPETLDIDTFMFDFVEKDNDKNSHYKCDEISNIKEIGILTDGSWVAKFHSSVDVEKWGFEHQVGPWYYVSEYDLNDLVDAPPSYENYPPAIHGEVNFTEKKLSRKNMLNDLLNTVGLSEAGYTNAEYKLEDGRRIDVVTETAEGWVSIEAMDARGKCDDEHFDKGINSYPMNLRKEEGNCVAAVVIAAEFTDAQIKRANEINNVGWMIALVTAEEVDGKTTFTLVN